VENPGRSVGYAFQEQVTLTTQPIIERMPKPFYPSPDPCLHRPERTVDLFRDLLLGESLEVGELDYFTLLG
jgi:hypothetical protein